MRNIGPGEPSRTIGSGPSAGRRRSTPRREYVDGAQTREPVTEAQRKAVLRLNRLERELGADGAAIVHDVLVKGMTMEQVGQRRGLRASAGMIISRAGFANASTGSRCSMVLRRELRRKRDSYGSGRSGVLAPRLVTKCSDLSIADFAG